MCSCQADASCGTGVMTASFTYSGGTNPLAITCTYVVIRNKSFANRFDAVIVAVDAKCTPQQVDAV
jgi:hypothetical protein